MSLNISEFKETIEINGNDLANNSMLINELLVNDLLISLGYNKRKNKNVKRLYNNILDWEIVNPNYKVAVKAITSTDLSNNGIDEVLNTCAEKKIGLVLVVTESSFNIYRFNKETLEYLNVKEISLLEELDEQSAEIIDAISNETYNLDVLDEILYGSKVTFEEVAEVFANNLDKLKTAVSNWMNLPYEDISEHCDKFVLARTESAKDAEIAELTKKLKEKQDAESNVNSEIIDNFKNQIKELSDKYGQAMFDLEEANKQIEEYKKQIDELSGNNRKRAIELLDIIEDNPDLNRSYVAVINNELLQFETLYTFVGRVLQKLYELENFEASKYIFNANVFKLVQPATRNDLIMNNKAYDIELDSVNEDEALNKLRILFNHFDNIIFECKKIGTLNLNTNETPEEYFEDDIDEPDNNFIVEDESNWEQSNETEFSTLKDKELEQSEEVLFSDKEETFSGISLSKDTESVTENVDADTSENSDELDVSDLMDNEDEFDEPKEVSNSVPSQLIVHTIKDIDSLVWRDENIQFNNILYIGSQDVTFTITLDEHSTLDVLLCKCLDAVLATEVYNGGSEIITELKQAELGFVNNCIKLYSDEYRNCPRINGTHYVITGVQSIQQIATIILDICNTMHINTANKYIYFDVVTDSKVILDNYGFNEEAIQLRDTEYFKPSNEDSNIPVIIRGDLFNYIMVTKHSLQAHKDIFINVSAVKTKYFVKQSITKQDIPGIISEIINEGYKQCSNVSYDKIGNVIGEGYRIASLNQEDVSSNYKAYTIAGNTVYISELEDWQIPHALIKLHTTLFLNTAIAIKTSINVDAVNYYGGEFETTEPSLSLATKSLADYIARCAKNA